MQRVVPVRGLFVVPGGDEPQLVQHLRYEMLRKLPAWECPTLPQKVEGL